MAKRIDWERVERDYRAGQITVRQIAQKHAISTTAITAHMHSGGWTRDLSQAIQARTQAKISEIDVQELIEQSAREGAQKSAQTIRLADEQASDVAAGVIIRHRKSFRDQVERAAVIERLFDEILVASSAYAGDGAEPIDIHKAAAAFKALVDSRAKLVAMERESFGISGPDTPDARDVDAMPACDAWRVCSDGLG